MRLVEVVQIAAALLAAVAAGLRINIRRIERRLRAAQATSPDRAIPLRVRTPVARLAQRRLVSAGAIRSLADGRLYIDESAWGRWTEGRRKRALTAVTLVLVLIVVLWLTGVFQ